MSRDRTAAASDRGRRQIRKSTFAFDGAALATRAMSTFCNDRSMTLEGKELRELLAGEGLTAAEEVQPPSDEGVVWLLHAGAEDWFATWKLLRDLQERAKVCEDYTLLGPAEAARRFDMRADVVQQFLADTCP